MEPIKQAVLAIGLTLVMVGGIIGGMACATKGVKGNAVAIVLNK